MEKWKISLKLCHEWNEVESEWKSTLTIFLYNIALYVIGDNEDHELKSIKGLEKKNYVQTERDNSSERDNSICDL